MTHFRDPRHLIGSVVLVSSTLLVVACASSATDEPTAPTSQPSPPAPAAPETVSAAPQPRECMGRVSVGSSRSLSIDNGDSLLSDNWISFNCWDGPTVAVTQITDTAVSFKDYRPPVAIANGSSATVGTYQITVLSIDGDTATFRVVAPSG